MQSDGPENFIDPAREEVSAGSTEPDRTAPPGSSPGPNNAPEDPEQFGGPIQEFRPLDLRDAERIELEKQREGFFAYQDERQAKRRKQNAEAKKAEREANANEWADEHARKHSQTKLWRDWISIGIIIATALAGICTTIVGARTGTTQTLVTGVAILSGTSGSAILGLIKNHPPDDRGQEP